MSDPAGPPDDFQPDPFGAAPGRAEPPRQLGRHRAGAQNQPAQPDAAWPPGQAGPASQPGAPDQADAPYRAARHASGSSRRLGWMIGILVVVLAVLGGGVFAVAAWWPEASVNPAERMPDSVLYYGEINLDPSFDQTPKLLSLLNKFDALDEMDDNEEVIADLLEQLELDDVDVDVDEDLTSWLGTRAALAVWMDEDAAPNLVVAAASKDDDKAETGLANLMEDDDDELAFVVEDGLAILLLAEEGDADDRLDDFVSDSLDAPLSESDKFSDAIAWLDGDQLMLHWLNLADLDDFMKAVVPPGELPDYDMMLESGMYDSMFNTDARIIVAVQASDHGLDLHFRDLSGEARPGSSTWLDELGRLPDAQVAAQMLVPDDIGESFDELIASVESYVDDVVGTRLDEFNRGQWEYDLAMTEDELAEYDDLYGQWEADQLAEGDPDFDTFAELDEKVWLFGLQSDYDDAIADGMTEEEWRFNQSLTLAEFDEFVELEDLVVEEALPTEAEERYYELDIRLYRHGIEPDYDLYVNERVDVAAVMTEALDAVSGAQITGVLSNIFGDEPDFGLALELRDTAADDFWDLVLGDAIAEIEELPEFEDLVTTDGSTLTIGEMSSSDSVLADNEWFAAAFADAPDEADLALYVDVESILSSAPDDVEWIEPIKAVSIVSDSSENGGRIRVVID